MAVIDIRRKHGRSLKEAKAAVERVATAIGEEYGISYAWEGNTLEFGRGGVRGTIEVAKHDVRVHAELGLLMGAMKSLIEREISRKFDEEFGDADDS